VSLPLQSSFDLLTYIIAWGEIWNALGPLVTVGFEGNAVAKKDDLLFFDRLTERKLPEETYHTWEWVPVTQEDGMVGGLLNGEEDGIQRKKVG